MWAYICPELLKAIEAEPETSLVSEHLNSMARCIEILGRGCLNEQAMADLVKIMISTMTEHFERQAERNKKRSDEDYDEGKVFFALLPFWTLFGVKKDIDDGKLLGYWRLYGRFGHFFARSI